MALLTSSHICRSSCSARTSSSMRVLSNWRLVVKKDCISNTRSAAWQTPKDASTMSAGSSRCSQLSIEALMAA